MGPSLKANIVVGALFAQRPLVHSIVWDIAVRRCRLFSVVDVGRAGWSAHRGISSTLAGSCCCCEHRRVEGVLIETRPTTLSDQVKLLVQLRSSRCPRACVHV